MRGKPFEPGNKIGRGRPRGSRNKTTILAQQLLDQHVEPLIKKCIVMAMQGDTKAMQLCLDRIVPARRELPVRIGKILTRTPAELADAFQALTQKVTGGQLTPTQGKAFAEVFELHRQAIETHGIDKRVRAMEERQCAA